MTNHLKSKIKQKRTMILLFRALSRKNYMKWFKRKIRKWWIKNYTLDFHYHPRLNKQFLRACFNAHKSTMIVHPEYKKSKLDTYFYLSYSKRFLGEWIEEVKKSEKDFPL